MRCLNQRLPGDIFLLYAVYLSVSVQTLHDASYMEVACGFVDTLDSMNNSYDRQEIYCVKYWYVVYCNYYRRFGVVAEVLQNHTSHVTGRFMLDLENV